MLGLLLANLRVLPAVQQPLLFQRLLPLVAGIPSAAQRTRGLAALWSAVLAYDWAVAGGERGGGARAARGGGAAAPPTPQLQQLLLEPRVKEIVSGLPGSGDVSAMSAAAASSAPAVFPAFREELVGCLLYVLLSHPRGAAGAAARGGAAPAGASSSVAEASELQALSEAAEWLTSAKTALQVGLGSGRLAGLWGLLRVAWWLVQSGETCQVRHAPPSMPDLAPALPPPSSLTHTSPPGHQGVPGLGPRGGGPHHRHHRRHKIGRAHV